MVKINQSSCKFVRMYCITLNKHLSKILAKWGCAYWKEAA